MASLNLRRFSEPDTLRTIDPKRLAKFLAPWRTYLGSRGLKLPNGKGTLDLANLSVVLLSPGPDVPKDMVDALYYVHETSAEPHMDGLLALAVAEKIELEKDMLTTVADVAVQIWLASPDVLREFHAEITAFRQKNFLYYSGDDEQHRGLPVPNEELAHRMERTLDDWFEPHRRGRNSRISFFPRGERLWMLVRHGKPMRREASHSEQGEPATEFYRPLTHDVLVYDRENDELAIHAETKGEVKLYCSCVGRHFFDDERHFPHDEKFTLLPLVENGPSALACEDILGLEAVRLVELRRFWGGHFKEVETRKSSDLILALAERGKSLRPGGRLVSATFKVRFADSSKERSVVIRPPGVARYERDDDSEIVETWLKERGFMVKRSLDGFDEEAATVLERAD